MTKEKQWIGVFRRPMRAAETTGRNLIVGKPKRLFRAFANKEKFFAWVEEYKPALVVLDEDLKGYRKITDEIGSEILAEVQKISPETKSILISKKNMSSTATYILLSRAKPYDMAKLVDSILGI